ncbi:MAG: hypothetical protein ABFD69_02125 [Candidatus Sumerlaeia bacterium]
MGHHITAFIVKKDLARKVSAREPRLKSAPLRQGLALFPVSDELLDEVFPSTDGPDFPEMLHLGGGFAGFLIELSGSGPVMYFWTEYLGGNGAQAAIVFKNGEVVYRGDSGEVKPMEQSKGPINAALGKMGALSLVVFDRFDAVGLGKYRDTWDVLESLR